MSDLSTINKRWYITLHPLYDKVFQELVDIMQIEGLSEQSLPVTLHSKPNLASETKSSSISGSVKRYAVPTNKMHCKNVLTAVTSQINEIAAKDKNVYAAVMPQLTKILKNATLM